MSSLKKQTSTVTEKSQQSESMQVPISDNVVVMEREFKSQKAHSDCITNMLKIDDSSVVTSSLDKSFKIWDRHLQGCRYTIETHEPLHTMGITGEDKNFLVAGYGDKDFIVMNKDGMKQNHISHPPAHDGKIVQIISLEKLKDKYFATRCQYGDLGIWGSNKHPDRVIKIHNIDDPDYIQIQDEPKPETKKKKSADDEEGEDGQDEEEFDEDGNPIPKKAAEAVVVEKDFSDRTSSVRDKMIEIKDWSESII